MIYLSTWVSTGAIIDDDDNSDTIDDRNCEVIKDLENSQADNIDLSYWLFIHRQFLFKKF